MATGHIRKRITPKGKVSYQIIVEGNKDPLTGKRDRHFETVKCTKKQAEAILAKRIADMQNCGIVQYSTVSLSSWLETWLNSYNPNIQPTTKAGYKEKIDCYIIPALGNISLSLLSANMIQTFVNDMNKKGLSPKTIRNAYNNLNASLKKAVQLRMIPYNPCEGVVLPTLIKYEANVLDSTKINEVLKAAKGTDMYIFALLAFSLGLRRGELDGLRWSHINFKNKTIKVCENRVNPKKESPYTKQPKTKSGMRTLSIGDELVQALKEAKEEYEKDKQKLGASFQDLGYVIRKKDGTPFHPDSLTQKWRRFLNRQDIKGVRLHDSRHSNATALIQAGVSPKVVQHRLGHADISTTLNIYTHVLPEMDAEAADVLDSLMIK